jgi:oleate hydratase
MVSGFERLHGIMRTVYNQHDSLVRPLRKWLEAHGVVFELGARVTNLGFAEINGESTVTRLFYEKQGVAQEIVVGPHDHVLATLGSMTAGSSLGAMDSAPAMGDKNRGGAWPFWESIASGRPQCGRPGAFTDHIDQSKWVSFTTTLHDPALLDIVRDRTGNMPGEGGLITFPQSNWTASIVIPFQPHFIGQPADVGVIWGYGLAVDKPGNFVNKPMSACSGREIMTEVLGHLRVEAEAQAILADCICIPCMMPFITSQFLCRAPGDRPQVLPRGSRNLAFMGQFCEMPDDVVFTVEYSIRSAQTAVYALLGSRRRPPAVYKGEFDPRVLYKAFRALHDMRA